MKKTDYFKVFIGTLILFMMIMFIEAFDVYGEESIPMPPEISAMFDEIEDFVREETYKPDPVNSDKVQTYIMKVLFSHGYTEENSGVLVSGMENKETGFKRLQMIIVQIHEDNGLTHELVIVIQQQVEEKRINV